MAGFQTHITVSCLLGAGYAWIGESMLGVPTPSALVAGGLCGVSGMLPDVDSDSGVPARETIGFAAAIVPMLLVSRMLEHGGTLEHAVLYGAPLYLLIRFGFGTLLKRFTVHRGMFHSIPANLIVILGTYALLADNTPPLKWYKAFAVGLGFLSHLVLDEIWSVQVTATGARLKQSFGTALKLFGNDSGSNAACYGLLIMAALFVFRDPTAAISLREIVTGIGKPSDQRRPIALPTLRPAFPKVIPRTEELPPDDFRDFSRRRPLPPPDRHALQDDGFGPPPN